MLTNSLKDNYRLASCCKPSAGDNITGFLKFDPSIMSVHKADCPNLLKVEKDRLVTLTWEEITGKDIESTPADESAYSELDPIDFKILEHHQKKGRDYAAVVARITRIDRATVFSRHKKLRDLDLLVRVKPVMMRYRKGIVDNKWVKHRNHTYYELTSKGREYIQYYLEHGKEL